MPRLSRSSAAAAGALACLAFVLIGWSGLLVPSLIRTVEKTFAQSDAGIGIFYFIYATVYALGSLCGGLVTERLGRRTVLSLGVAFHGAGFVVLGIAPSWLVFALAALPAGLGAGVIDGGMNGLILALYPSGRGRALNLLHVFFSVGALVAPLAVGRLLDIGVEWQALLVTTGAVAFLVAALFAVVEVPSGRHSRIAREGSGKRGRLRSVGGRFATPMILLAVAIGCYVAAEVGVSNWLVRFLEPAPLSQATTALALYWAGLALGRLISARISDRFDHLLFALACSTAMAAALLVAILVPDLPVSVVFFALAGVATGPVYPMIMAIGGDRYPDRSAAVSGFLAGAAVVGSIVYPPIMGFLSVTVGLMAAMLGAFVLALACAGSLVLVRRMRPSAE